MVTRALATVTVAGLAAGAVAGCNFSVFDDLTNQAWVDRVQTPSTTDSRQYGEAIVATPSRAVGTNVVVIGRSRASISQLQYDDEGKRQSVQGIDPRQTLSFSTFPDNPTLVGDPDSDRVAFTVVQGENVDPTRIAVYDGRNLGAAPFKSVILSTDLNVDGTMRHNIYAEGVSFGSIPGFGTAAEKELLVTRGPEVVLIQDYAQSETAPATTFDLKGCLHGAHWAYGAVIADILPDAMHAGPEIVFGSGEEMRDGSSQVTIMNPSFITAPVAAPNNCAAGGPPLLTITSTEDPGDLGAEIITADFPDDPGDPLVDLVYSAPSINKVFVRFSGGTGTEINAGENGSLFGNAITTGDLDGDGVPELIVGAPRSDPEGVTNGGSVYVYKFVTTPTPGFELAMTLYPAQPAAEEQFGKSVTVAPFGAGGTNSVLVVGAEGEVFTYFRTLLYDDVRAGRAP